jgi:site-specific recombinase XerD
MLSEIRPRAYLQYISLPILGPILDEFTSWSHQRGYTIFVIRGQLKAARQFDGFFRQRGAQSLSDLTHSDFEEAWHYYHDYRPSMAGTVRQIEQFLEETRGLASPLPQPKTPTGSELDRFADYLRDVRGLQTTTIQSYTRYLHNFLEYICYDVNPQTLVTLTSKEIEGFLCICAKRLNRYSLQHVVGYLRAFLRFRYEQGALQSPLHTMIDTPRIYRLEQLPRSLSWEMVKALLLSIDRMNAHGIRDYTMLFLIATYGLRTCEVVSLTLDDIDWRTGVIRIHQRKNDNPLILPLTDAAGDVLIEYLKKSRPQLPYRQLFLRVRAPHGPLKPTAVTNAFQLRVRLSGLDIPYLGPHCLRHSYAVHLLRQGTSAKAIGDLLGHRSAESTYVYLRLSIEDLRSVALPMPQRLEVNLPMSINVANCQPNVRGRNLEAGQADPRSSHSLKSFIAEEIRDFLDLKRSLGRDYGNETITLHSLDAFLATQYPLAKDFVAEMFNLWCTTLHHLSATVRRSRMLYVRKLCLYLQRSRPQQFIPDLLTFPAHHQQLTPHILSESDIARILSATQHLCPYPPCPLRPQTLRIALLLLYTTGLRRGELLRLKLGDFNAAEATLLIQDTKFHKSRLIPLSPSVAAELEEYLALRHKNRLPMEITSPFIWNGCGGPEGKAYTGTGFASNWRALCVSLGILTRKGRPPRIHDLRHSFAVNVLQRWYQAGEDVQTKLPLLSTYMAMSALHRPTIT